MTGAAEGVRAIDHLGYQGCLALDNGDARVVLGHHAGGRVLEYSTAGQNALFVDPAQAGWTWKEGEPAIHITGGRCDIGPEHVIPRHPTMWLGPWTAEAAGPRHARLSSQDDAPTGTRLIRDFVLDATGTRLAFTQTIVNVSDKVTEWCHWSRTFAPHGGIAVVPVTCRPMSRFPRGYVMYEAGASTGKPGIGFRPEDPNITRHTAGDYDVLVIRPVPLFPKLGFDSYAGWLAYLEPNGLLFVKRFPTYPDRVYNEVAAITSCVYYPAREFVELEPIGPRETLSPGESASFTEEWSLLSFPFPASSAEPDVAALVERVRAALSAWGG
ncbi:MAG TPA: hypothetical protein VFX49_17350 [Chloroflexota bacterium]|nr:hypothetical protein [Chloroflexota bacterium]